MTQLGISSFGVYLPRQHLARSAIAQAHAWAFPNLKGLARGARAYGSFDEDSITMAVEAGTDCLKGTDRKSVDALYFASTTAPFKEKQSASFVAAALDLPEGVATSDFGNSLRAGTLAMRSALDAVKAGSAKKVLVVVADSQGLSYYGDPAILRAGEAAFRLLVAGRMTRVMVAHRRRSYNLSQSTRPTAVVVRSRPAGERAWS